jgi:hypothetical protein
VIPALGSTEALEATLVSVLQSRPSDCEIVVALDRAYDDPYQLADEVRFVNVGQTSGLAAMLAATLRHCRAPIVHVLAAGAEVDDGWSDAAVEHFCDDRIAAVAPLLLYSREETNVCSAGLGYGRGGRRVRLGRGEQPGDFRSGDDVLGPTHLAGFYRRDALLRLPQAFDATVTDALFDVDLALQLKRAGYRAVVEPQTIVYRLAAASPEVDAFAVGRGAERLFWRNAPTLGWVGSLAAHPFTMLGELTATRSVGEKLRRVLGRAVALFEVIGYRRHHTALKSVGTPGLQFAVTSTGDRIRFDAPHARSTTIAKPTPTADRRSDGETGRAA